MFNKVTAVVLFVEDLDRAKAFYHETLGLEITFEDDVSFAFRLENQDFALVKRSAGIEMLNAQVLASQTSVSHQVMLCADVADVDTVYKSLTAKGVSFIKPPIDQPWGWRTAYFADPEGNLWELRQPKSIV